MKNEQIKKLEWENENEFNYRKETGEIIFRTGNILKAIGEIATKKGDLYSIKEKINKEYNKMRNLIIPNRYHIVHDFLLNCLKSYKRASNILDAGIKENNSALIYKAGRYINEGNSWMEIAKIKIWESIEDAVYENNKDKGV